MTLLWMEGFDLYGGSTAPMLAGLWSAVGDATLSTAQVRTGSHSLSATASSVQSPRRNFGGTKTTAGVGFGLYMPALPPFSDRVRFSFRDNANVEQVRVVVQTTGDIAAIRGSTTLGATSAPALTAGAWSHVEIKVVCHASAGAVEVRVNGVTVLNLTGVNTKNTALAGVDQFSFDRSGGAWSIVPYIDDVFAWDTLGVGPTDFIGDRRVVEDVVNADGVEQDWTRSSGAISYALLNEKPPNDDASYISAVAVGAQVALKFPALPSDVAAVVAVQYGHYTRKTDAGTANIQPSVRSGGLTTAGTDRPMTTAYTYWPDIFATDPATGAPFTPAGLNGAELLITRTA